MVDDAACDTETLRVEYKACEVCGEEPDGDRIPPMYVYSLDPDDRDDEHVMAKPFGGSLSVPFACSEKCWQAFFEENPEVEP